VRRLIELLRLRRIKSSRAQMAAVMTDEIEQGAVRMREAEHVAPHIIIEHDCRAEGAEAFQQDSECDPDRE
jgi:hypothetical protein